MTRFNTSTHRAVRRVTVIATLLLLGCHQIVRAQDDGKDVAARLDALSDTLRSIQRQLSDLSSSLKSILPPPAVTDAANIELNISGAAWKGVAEASIVMVEFSDFECPFCGQHSRTAYRNIQQEFVERKKVKYVFRNMPIEQLHPHALKAAEAAECAREQGQFWEMHDRLFSSQQALMPSDLLSHAKALTLDVARFESCLDSDRPNAVVKRDLADAKRLGLTATPSFLFGEALPDGNVRVTKKIVGAQPYQTFADLLDALLKK